MTAASAFLEASIMAEMVSTAIAGSRGQLDAAIVFFFKRRTAEMVWNKRFVLMVCIDR